MPEERFEVRMSFRKLLVGLLLALIPSVAGLYSITRSHTSLETSMGGHFQTIAEGTAAAVSQFIHDRVIDVAMIAAEPGVVDAVVAGNNWYVNQTETAITERFQKLDQAWNTHAAEGAVRQILASRVSNSLRRHRELDPRILRITITDARGGVVAASHKTLDYYQADEEYWRNIYADGRGSISLTDVLYDEATKTHYIGVGVPVLDPVSNQFIGTVDALVDVSTLFPIVNRVRLGFTGRTLLVKEDGFVVSAPEAAAPLKMKSQELAAVSEASSGRRSGYLVAGIQGRGNTLIGFAETDLKRDYHKLGWSVLVCQDVSEALAAVHTVERLIAFMSLLGIAVVTFLAVYFSLHRKRPFTEIGELRPETTTAGG